MRKLTRQIVASQLLAKPIADEFVRNSIAVLLTLPESEQDMVLQATTDIVNSFHGLGPAFALEVVAKLGRMMVRAPVA